MLRLICKHGVAAGIAALCAAPAGVSAATLVADHQPRAVIVVPASIERPARGSSRDASDPAGELRSYIAKATGASLPIIPEDQLSTAATEQAKIFVGPCAATKAAIDAPAIKPEGFVIRVDGANVFIVGGDRTKEGLTVSGTAYGCYAFLEKFLGVRWLMPGELGEVIPLTATLAPGDTEIREEPLLWQRRLRDSELHGHRDRIPKILQDWGVPLAEWEKNFATETTGPWFRHQRLGSRARLEYGHAFGGWWDRYHEKYPEIFALQPNGTRNTGGYREKLCVSNPQLWDLVAQEKIRQLRADPFLSAASISPNDGGGSLHCSCAQCLAWDPKRPTAVADDDPDARAEGVQHSLTDRYFRFYNEVARRVAAELPDRFLGAYAYSIYRTPPVELDHLEKNLVVGYVGFNSYVNDRLRAQDRDYWVQWSRLAGQLFIRPNVFWFGFGMPQNYVRKLGSDLQFMAAHGMRAADYDGLVGNWGTDGLNYYAAARLLWNPEADTDAIVLDYCQAAYGPGASAMRDYYARLEALNIQIATEGKYTGGDSTSMRANAHQFVGYYSDALLDELRGHTARATQAIGASDAKAAARVQLVVEGLECARHVRDLIVAAAAVRNGKSTEDEYRKVFAAENRYFASKAMSWAVSMPHNYSYIRATLSLKPAAQ